MYRRDSVINQILSIHETQANNIVKSSASKLVKDAFTSTWSQLNHGSIYASVTGERLIVNASGIKETISKWIKDFQICIETEEAKFNRIEDPSSQEKIRLINLRVDIDSIIYTYEGLKAKIDKVDVEFANTARAYRSPLQQALNDINQLYMEINQIEGDFTGFKNVSVYIHGIEGTGEDFLDSAKKAANIGDVIVYEKRDGTKEYFIVTKDDKGKKFIRPLGFKELQSKGEYRSKKGRLHLIYETEYKNEHRQKTSDDLAKRLIEMGLLNDETWFDMFAHSYGGRRSFQFAMDYPENVRSITTIGTPYDTNILAKMAHYGSNLSPKIADYFNKHPTEFSDHLDFNPSNMRLDKGVKHSNAYTDMTSEAMTEDIDHLKVANPEVYRTLNEMEIAAAAGRDVNTRTYYSEFTGSKREIKVEYTNDGAVSVKSQNAERLGELIDYRPVYDVKGYGITNPAHVHQIENEEFIQLIKQVNQIQKE